MSLTLMDCKATITSITVQFSEPVDESAATTSSNYRVGTPSAALGPLGKNTKVDLDSDGKTATITFLRHGATLSLGQELRVVVSGIQTIETSETIGDGVTCLLTDGAKDHEAAQKNEELRQLVESLKLQLEQQQSYGFCGLIKTKEGRPLKNYRFEYFAADGKQSLGTGSTDEDGMYSFDSKLAEVVLEIAGEHHRLSAKAANL